MLQCLEEKVEMRSSSASIYLVPIIAMQCVLISSLNRKRQCVQGMFAACKSHITQRIASFVPLPFERSRSRSEITLTTEAAVGGGSGSKSKLDGCQNIDVLFVIPYLSL